MLNLRIKVGELNKRSIVLNGYGNYSNGYHEEEEARNIFEKYWRIVKKKFKSKS